MQFLVERKKRVRSRRRLPRFVYARDRSGRVDHRMKFPTDVVEVGTPGLACGAGSPLSTSSEDGTITLLFRNRAARRADAWYVLTCSHVASDLVDSPPDDPDLRSACVGSAPLARTIKNALPDGRALAYDIALAEVSEGARRELGRTGLRRLERLVVDDGTRLTGFLPRDEIRPPLEIQVQLGVSGGANGRLSWGPGVLQVRLDGTWLSVSDVYMSDAAAQPGDSGGIVFVGNAAVGVVFARSDARQAWMQPLEPALLHLSQLEPAFELRPF